MASALEVALLLALTSGISSFAQDGKLVINVQPQQAFVFADGRAILKGSTDPAIARSLYARYIGA